MNFGKLESSDQEPNDIDDERRYQTLTSKSDIWRRQLSTKSNFVSTGRLSTEKLKVYTKALDSYVKSLFINTIISFFFQLKYICQFPFVMLAATLISVVVVEFCSGL